MREGNENYNEDLEDLSEENVTCIDDHSAYFEQQFQTYLIELVSKIETDLFIIKICILFFTLLAMLGILALFMIII